MESISRKCPNCDTTVGASASQCHSCNISFENNKETASCKSKPCLPPFVLLLIVMGGAVAVTSMYMDQSKYQVCQMKPPAEPAPTPEPAPSAIPQPTPRRGGNIYPYKKELLRQLASAFRYQDLPNTSSGTDETSVMPELAIVVGKKVDIRSFEIIESSGKNDLDSAALQSVESIHLPPLPYWYLGEELTFKIDFEKIRLMQSKEKL